MLAEAMDVSGAGLTATLEMGLALVKDQPKVEAMEDELRRWRAGYRDRSAPTLMRATQEMIEALRAAPRGRRTAA